MTDIKQVNAQDFLDMVLSVANSDMTPILKMDQISCLVFDYLVDQKIK